MGYGTFLLVGDWGTGKTTAVATAGTKEHPVLFLDMDNKLHRMMNLSDALKEGRIIQWAIDEKVSEIGLRRLVTTKHDQGGKMVQQKPRGYEQLVTYIEKLIACKCVVDGKQLGGVCLDSYTTVTEHIKRLILAVNDKMTMTQPLYGALLSNYEELNSTLLNVLGKYCHVFIICHESAEKDDLTGQISYRPLIEGQMKFKIGKDFEEVYAMKKEVRGGKATYWMDPIGDAMRSCRTSRNLEGKVEPDFQKILGGQK